MAEQQAYQKAMRVAASAAWDQDWTKAAEAYKAALTAIPNETQALTGLAESLIQLGQDREAMALYERLSELVPHDPLSFEKIAYLYERQNKIGEAATAYLQVAELYYARRDMNRAVMNWRLAAQYNTDLPKPHMRLAVLYEQNHDLHAEAVIEYLEMARLLQEYGQTDKADASLRRAAKLDPINQIVRGALDDLKRGRPIPRTSTYQNPGQKPNPANKLAIQDTGIDEDGEGEKHRTPSDEAARYAMGVLAEIIWTGAAPSQALPHLLSAMDVHAVGDLEGAIEGYTRAHQAGLDHPALRFNLGILHHYAGDFDQAIGLISPVKDEKAYAIAANLAIGLAYHAQGKLREAATYIVDAMEAADRDVNSQPPDSEGYQKLRTELSEKPDDYQDDLVRAFAIYLEDELWRDKTFNMLDGYAAQGKSSYVHDLVQLIMEGGRPILAEIMEQVDFFMNRNMYTLASMEAHYAIEKTPDYLPAHRRIADILVIEGKTQEAAEKINLVAETYMMRGNAERAADLFAEVIKIWPADIDARRRVLEMLKMQGRVDDALNQYVGMGDLYYRMLADPNTASKYYEDGLEYADQHGSIATPVIALLKALADIESQRLNWHTALENYQRVLTMAPDDEQATLAVVDLNFQMGDTARAISTLDSYMKACITRGQTDKILSTLEDQVRRYPEQITLRQRLAQVYQRAGRNEDAVAQLNEIGDAQIEAGDYTAAAATVKRIISLNPADLGQYEDLLRQLETPGGTG